MRISRAMLLSLMGLLWAVFVGLSLSQWNGFEVLNSIGFLALTIMPGAILSLCIKAGHNLPFWARVGQSIGLSIFVELLWVLICNTVLPFFFVARPLDRVPLLAELSVLNLGIGIWSWPRLRFIGYVIGTRQKLRKIAAESGMALLPFVLVMLGFVGAVSLNNGGTGVITLIMLILATIYLFTLLCVRNRLGDSAISWGVYFVSLALLLMTSMRGWYVTGHDIQHEYLVFQIAQSKGDWNIGNFRDPYNACLSITILPTIFFNLLHIGSQYVYKILFQLLFAVVPVLIYQIMRLYVSKAKSLLAVIYFIAFPTFFTDMAYLNRQEMAYLFLVLMIFFILNKRVALQKRKLLFTTFGLGVVLSHYSTTYAMLFIVAFAVAMRIGLGLTLPRMGWLTRIFSRSSISILHGRKQVIRTMTIPMILILICGAFIWNVILTDTASGATSLVSQVVGNFTNGLNAGTRSNDVSYSIIGSSAATPQQLVDGYQKTLVAPQVKKAPQGTYYPTSEVRKYPLTPGKTEYTPLTKVGRYLAAKHLDVFQLNYQLKQSSAKLVQLLAIIGLCYVIFSSSFSTKLETDYLTLSMGGLFFVALQVVVPFLSEAYGLLRAFQQSLIMLGMYLVAGTFAIGRLFGKIRIISLAIPVGTALVFFVSTTGIVSEILGGYEPQLQFSNSGVYYDQYYMHAQELAADIWLVNNVAKKTPNVEVQTDLDTAVRLDSETGYQAQNDITPALIKTYSYVLLGYNDTVNKQAFISFSGNTIPYNYPIQFLNANKDLIYSNGGSEVYR